MSRARRSSSAPAAGCGRNGHAVSTSIDREQNQAIREWARKHDFKVSDRVAGSRAEVLESYHKSN